MDNKILNRKLVKKRKNTTQDKNKILPDCIGLGKRKIAGQKKGKGGKAGNEWVWEVLGRIHSKESNPAQFPHTHNLQQPSLPFPLAPFKSKSKSIGKKGKSEAIGNRRHGRAWQEE